MCIYWHLRWLLYTWFISTTMTTCLERTFQTVLLRIEFVSTKNRFLMCFVSF